jgi:hypothetical protein
MAVKKRKHIYVTVMAVNESNIIMAVKESNIIT